MIFKCLIRNQSGDPSTTCKYWQILEAFTILDEGRKLCIEFQGVFLQEQSWPSGIAVKCQAMSMTQIQQQMIQGPCVYTLQIDKFSPSQIEHVSVYVERGK